MQAIKSEKEIVNGQNLYPSKASLHSIASHGVRAKDRACLCGWRFGLADRQAVQDAPPVHHPLDLATRGGKGFADALVHHEHGALVAREMAHGLEGTNGLG